MNTSFYVSLDKDALYHNIEYLREYKQKELLPVIKANAYGHNSLLIAKALYDFNLKVWAVGRFSEAISITEYMMDNFSISDFRILVFESLKKSPTIPVPPNRSKKDENVIFSFFITSLM